eukprot:PhM_4_TR357/c0_g1_i2/m.63542
MVGTLSKLALGWVSGAATVVVLLSIPPVARRLKNIYYKLWPIGGAFHMHNLVCGMHHSAAVTAAIRVGLFDLLSKRRAMTPEDAAAELHLHAPGVARLLRLLCALDLCAYCRTTNQFSLRCVAQRHLLSSPSPSSMAGMMSCFNHKDVKRAVDSLEAVLRSSTGECQLADHGAAGSRCLYWADHAVHSGDAASGLMPVLSKIMSTHCPKALTVMDVGCGSGAVGVHLAEAMPSVHLTLVDFKAVLDRVTLPADHRSQFKLLPMDFLTDAVPATSRQRSDVVLMLNLLEHFSDDDIIQFLRKAKHECLNSSNGGAVAKLIIGEPVVPEMGAADSFAPAVAHTFDLLLYTFTPHGQLRTVNEWKALFKKEGSFNNVHTHSVWPMPFVFFICD